MSYIIITNGFWTSNSSVKEVMLKDEAKELPEESFDKFPGESRGNPWDLKKKKSPTQTLRENYEINHT